MKKLNVLFPLFLSLMVIISVFSGVASVRADNTIFPDVSDPSSSIYKPVYWAVDQGIVQGYSNGNFGPEDSCTREQFVVMIWRMNDKPTADASVSFTDINSSRNTYKAIQWAVDEGIIKGFSDGSFRPTDTVTREQVAVMLWRMKGKPSAYGSVSFSDVSSDMSTYKPIQWGYSAGIIKGYSDNTFKPADDCLRQHIVIFLYRYSNERSGSSDIVDRGNYGSNITWTLDRNGVLTLSGNGVMANALKEFSPSYFQNDFTIDPDLYYLFDNLKDDIKKIVVNKGITTIGDGAFHGLSVTSVELPSGITYIGDQAFGGCGALHSINIPETVTKIGALAFSRCNLSQITIPASVREIGTQAFAEAAKYITVATGNPSFSSNDGVLFNKNQTELICFRSTRDNPSATYTIPSSVKKIGDNAFRYADISELIIPNTVTSIGTGSFAYSYIQRLVLPAGLKEIPDGAFLSCVYMKKIFIPSTVRSIGFMSFSETGSLWETDPYKIYYGGTSAQWLNISFNNSSWDNYLEQLAVKPKVIYNSKASDIK